MNFLKIIFIVSIFTFTSAQSNNDVDKPEWSYDSPNTWRLDYPICDGNRQSPIHLSFENSVSTANLPPLQFTNYYVPLTSPLILVNTGHSVNINLPPTLNGHRPTIEGGILLDRFEAVGLHFHWGSENNAGSEHVIAGRRFDVEMHIVHKNAMYDSIEEAVQQRDGLVVLAVMIEKANNPINYYPALYKILKNLPQVIENESETKLNYGFSLSNLLGDLYTKEYFTYKGSLTTPPCAEAVTWFVFPEPIPIRITEINKLFSLKNVHNETLIDNYRPLQNRNGRKIIYRFESAIEPTLSSLPSLPSLPQLPSLPNLPIFG